MATKKPTPLRLKRSFRVAFSPTKQVLASIGYKVNLWDLISKKKLFSVHPFSHPSNLAFSPDGSYLAVKNTAGRIVILDAVTGETACDFRNTKDGEGANLGYSPCGSYLIDASWKGTVFVRESETGRIVFSRTFPGDMISRVHRCCGGHKWLLLYNPKATTRTEPPEDGYYTVWEWPFDARGFKVLILRRPFIRDSISTSDGSRLAIVYGAPPTRLEIIQTSTSDEVAGLPVISGGTGHELAWSPDGSVLASVQKGKVILYDGADFRTLSETAIEYPSDVEFSPDGQLLAIGSWSDGVVVPIHDAIR